MGIIHNYWKVSFSSVIAFDICKVWSVRPEGGSAGASGPRGAMARGPTRVSSHRIVALLAG